MVTKYYIDTYYQQFIMYADFYGAESSFQDGILIIKYKMLGDGTLIQNHIENYLQDKKYDYLNIRMKPSEQILEIEVR